MRTPILPVLVLAVAVAGPARAQDTLDPRRIFGSEICEVDGLTPAQCDCAWKFLQGRLKERELRVAMLLTAASSESSADLARKADQALDASNVSDRRRDELQSEISALTVEAEDACVQ